MTASINGGFNLPAEGQQSVVTEIATALQSLDYMVAGKLTKSVAGGSNVTLSNEEARNAVLELTGLLTANISVIIPSTGSSRAFEVYNNTTGAFVLTIKYGLGTGVAVSQAKTRRMWHNGTNMLAGAEYDPLTGSAWTLAARVYNSAAISIPNNDPTAVLTFNSERRDDGAIHSTSSNTDRLTAPLAGWYRIGAHVSFAPNVTGIRAASIRLNAAGTVVAASNQNAVTGGNDTNLSFSTLAYLTAGEYARLFVFQNSGGALNVISGADYTPEFTMQRVG